MRFRIISEGLENRMHELSGILEENSKKIMKIGFNSDIADYLSEIDKKRGLFFADSLTRQFAEDRNVPESSTMNAKQLLDIISQDELFNYMKSRENDITTISNWIKDSQGSVNIREYPTFNEALAEASKSEESEPETEVIVFEDRLDKYLRDFDYDFGYEFGKLAIVDYIKFEKPELEGKLNNLSDAANSIDHIAFLVFLKDIENDFTTVIDWATSPVRQQDEGVLVSPEDKIGFMKKKRFSSLSDAIIEASNWHENIGASGVIEDHSKGKVIERYPDGYYWVDLETNRSYDEGKAMGHCGVDGRATTLISLRDEDGGPHVTVAYNSNTKTVGQVKGKNNTKPVSKYLKYVYDFLSKMTSRGDLYSFVWSYPRNGPDLNKEEVDKILSHMSARDKFKMAKKGLQKRGMGSNLR